MNMYGAVTSNSEAPNCVRCGKIILKILSKFEHTQKMEKHRSKKKYHQVLWIVLPSHCRELDDL
jgi:hypothetical protein